MKNVQNKIKNDTINCEKCGGILFEITPTHDASSFSNDAREITIKCKNKVRSKELSSGKEIKVKCNHFNIVSLAKNGGY